MVAGPPSVGKTCLLERFVNDIYSENSDPTMGVDCLNKTLMVDGSEVQLFLYDTAGQERFDEMASSYYRMGTVCLLCFVMSNISTFDVAMWWRRRVSDQNPTCAFILVGTKEDLVSKDERQEEKIRAIRSKCEREGLAFFPTSAKEGGDGINFLFQTVTSKCVIINLKKQLDAGGGTAGGFVVGRSQEAKKKCCG